jgi:5-methylthioribose kinase
MPSYFGIMNRSWSLVVKRSNPNISEEISYTLAKQINQNHQISTKTNEKKNNIKIFFNLSDIFISSR